MRGDTVKGYGSQVASIPIALSAEITLPIAAGGLSVPIPFDSMKLQNSYKVPIVVDAMIVSVAGVEADGARGNTNAADGDDVEFNLKLDRYDLTDEFVAFRTLAPWTFLNRGLSTINFPLATYSRSTRRVVFPQPLYLVPGSGLRASARINSTAATPEALSTRLARITLLCRAVPNIAKPATNLVPFWSQFYSVADVPSGELELRNPLRQPLTVRRITGAKLNQDGVVTNETDGTVQFRWPNGDLLNEGPVRWQSVFGRAHTFPVEFTLPPGTRIQAVVDASDTTLCLFGTRPEAV
jgi:hypothetical protein